LALTPPFITLLHSSNSILNPEAPLALRLQALLATGVVIIYAKQATFLLDDCQKALTHVATVMNGQPATAALDGKVAQYVCLLVVHL
jgi:hypothetical protein